MSVLRRGSITEINLEKVDENSVESLGLAIHTQDEVRSTPMNTLKTVMSFTDVSVLPPAVRHISVSDSDSAAVSETTTYGSLSSEVSFLDSPKTSPRTTQSFYSSPAQPSLIGTDSEQNLSPLTIQSRMGGTDKEKAKSKELSEKTLLEEFKEGLAYSRNSIPQTLKGSNEVQKSSTIESSRSQGRDSDSLQSQDSEPTITEIPMDRIFLVPALLPEARPIALIEQLWQEFPASEEENVHQYDRIYRFAFLPRGLFSSFLVGLLKTFNLLLLWANGFIGEGPKSKIYVENSYNTQLKMMEIKLIVRGASLCAAQQFFLVAVDMLETLSSKWEQLRCVRLVQSPLDVTQKKKSPVLFEIDAIKRKIADGCSTLDVLNQSIPIDWLVPDLTLADFQGTKVYGKDLKFEVGGEMCVHFGWIDGSF
eukprot:TRINITY_DN2156_c0_g1_i13.p1 TRINITY_DN2156_c0_g1~~TRINITY_DN2156_c0_g1_i13.p1  ORF type:complete len:422 (+),score=65.47 TRINITY_DN2156_c0_g1_i13:545-1810(+)